MKGLLLILSVVVIFSFTSQKQNHNNCNLQSDNKVNFKDLHCPAPTSFLKSIKNPTKKDDKEIDQNWYSKAMENIQKEEYTISFSEELNSYQSPNRKNNMRFIYHKDGFTAKNRENTIPLFDVNDKNIKEEDKKYETVPEWSIDFKISDIQRISSNERTPPSPLFQRGEQREVLLNESELSVSGNKASIENENIRINYTNNDEGMRQDFIIKKKPEGEGNLRLNIRADTKLKMIVGADALMFRDNQGYGKMKYSALKCWDAIGRELRAYFDVSKLRVTNYGLRNESKIQNPKSNIKTNSKFTIVVNDEDAIYPITIDPLSTTPNWSADESDQPGAYLGWSVSTAGDVNGDGYSDVIVGAPFYDNGQIDEGKAYIYYGSSSGLSVSSTWTNEGNQPQAYFGYSVSTAGDVNGDGFSDVLVSAYQYDDGETDEGAVFVYHGTALGLSPSVSRTLEVNQATAFFGYSVSTAGDVNGDGFSDVIIGASFFDNGQSDEGAAFVYHGSAAGLNATPNWTGENNQVSEFFGTSVSTAGDVNGDGYSDVIVGAINYTNGESGEGAAFVYHGSLSGLNGVNWTKESNQSDASFGYSVSTAGDVNGDGYSDVIIGAPYYTNGQTSEGGAYAYYGSASGLPSSGPVSWFKEINVANAFFGNSVSTAGDVNGDGYSDVIIGAPFYTNGQTDEGIAYVFNGSASGLNPTSIWNFESNLTDTYFGYSVSTAGDVNGDGFSDVIVGAYRFDNQQPNEGKAYVYHGAAAGLPQVSNWSNYGNQDGANFASSVSTAGDVNGDGYSDVIIGAPGYDDGQTDEGRAYIYFGASTGLHATADWTADGNQINAFFGSEVSTAGDVNGDGFSDIIVNKPGYVNGGAVYVYHGSGSGVPSLYQIIQSPQASIAFANSISTAGDVNGDGYGDVIIGAPIYSNLEYEEGKVFVYHGSSMSGLNFAWSIEGNQANAQFGYKVSTAGDVNGDGYSDVITSSPQMSRALVYYGSDMGVSSNNPWSVSNGTYFGNSISTAGDVNGDGYSDVIVGAANYANGQGFEGKVYAYYGSDLGLHPMPDWAIESNVAWAQYGFSVSTAGDVNGDGYSDIIFSTGVRYNPIPGAFVFHGSANGLSQTANWNIQTSNFVTSVSSAGDVNGDGYSDIIIGSPSYYNGFSFEGGAFVYYGNSGTGLRSTVQQYRPGTNTIVFSGWHTGTNGEVRLNIFGKSPFGRSDGKIVYEYKENGVPYSGSIITNSTSLSGSGVNTDLGTSITGVQLNHDISGLQTNKEYKWRARVQYNMVNNPYQKFGPWKYYTNYIPKPFGCFKASIIDNTPPAISYTILPDISNLSNRILNNVIITDANGVEGTSGKRPRIYFKSKSQPNMFNDNTNTTSGWKYAEASGDASPFSFTVDYSLLNGGTAIGDTIQYFVTAQDIRSFGAASVGINSGTFTAFPSSVALTNFAFPIGGTINSYIIKNSVTLNLTAFIQGFYNSVTNSMNQDTIIVYLRNASLPHEAIDSAKAMLSSSGQTSLNFYNASNGIPYYLQVKHRNSVETWSSAPQTFTNNSLTYDLSIADTQAYGNNMILADASPVRLAIYSGDVNQEGHVDLTDVILVNNASTIFVTGYVNTDVNGDSVTDLTDVITTYNNSSNFVSIKRP